MPSWINPMPSESTNHGHINPIDSLMIIPHHGEYINNHLYYI